MQRQYAIGTPGVPWTSQEKTLWLENQQSNAHTLKKS